MHKKTRALVHFFVMKGEFIMRKRRRYIDFYAVGKVIGTIAMFIAGYFISIVIRVLLGI